MPNTLTQRKSEISTISLGLRHDDIIMPRCPSVQLTYLALVTPKMMQPSWHPLAPSRLCKASPYALPTRHQSPVTLGELFPPQRTTTSWPAWVRILIFLPRTKHSGGRQNGNWVAETLGCKYYLETTYCGTQGFWDPLSWFWPQKSLLVGSGDFMGCQGSKPGHLHAREMPYSFVLYHSAPYIVLLMICF